MDIVGGYRLVRRLGAGERAEVFLGHAGVGEPSRGATAAIKIFTPGVVQGSIDQEVDVLSRTGSRHLLRLSDVASTSDGRQCLVFSRLGGGSLARLLADRPTLAQGEIVTILAPIADAIAELHASRCSHGALRPGSVLFDDVGAPVVACFGRASTFGAVRGETERQRATAAELMADSHVADDLRQLRALAGTLMARVSPSTPAGRGAEMLEWLDATERASESATFARELSARLFELAPALPVQLRSAPGVTRASAVQTSMNLRPDPRPLVIDASKPDVMVDRPAIASPLRVVTGQFLRRTGVAQAYQRAIMLTQTAAVTFATVRRPFRVAACAGLAAVVLALILVPATSGSREDRSGDSAAQGAALGSRQQPTPAPSQLTAPSTPTTTRTSGDGKKPLDDPVAAVTGLLRDRDGCIRTLSVTCLDSVDQRGSSSWDDDSFLIRSLQEGGVPPTGSLAGETFVLTERLGDSALLTAEPAKSADVQSILIIKGESGWRIRDFLAG